MLHDLAAGAIKVRRQWVEAWYHPSKDREQFGDGACQPHRTDLVLAMGWAVGWQL